MGKVKRGRLKAHIAAVKAKKDAPSSSQNVEVVDMDSDQVSATPETPFKSNIFEGINMNKFNITDKLPDFDTRSAITSKSLKDLKLKKKDKQKLRHELWMKKCDAIQSAKKAAKARKKKQQTPVVGDIGALADSLPTIDLLLKGNTGPKDNVDAEVKVKGIQKEKKRRKQMLSDISIFQQVIKHPAFKDNPTATISEHLHNKYQQDMIT